MGTVLPQESETRMLASQIEQALNMYGAEASLYLPESISMYLDRVNPGKGLPVKVVFDENPSKRLLKNLGWWTEDQESTPNLVYFPVSYNGETLVLQANSLIVFKDSLALKVEAVNRRYLYGIWLVAKCLPWERDNTDAVREKESPKTTFMNSNRTEVV